VENKKAETPNEVRRTALVIGGAVEIISPHTSEKILPTTLTTLQLYNVKKGYGLAQKSIAP